ncbi:hypothetical protein LAZ67_11002043 [Cordylochernes scorpioides]|uniref:Transposase n=1 Tax=Cordylochernes scorpioides TaxID=51811 RepID=A0ABY6L0P3_9ARAC|nr:hypothetical protein LAZ67_11002043 [Cordylochernes scorpioides]
MRRVAAKFVPKLLNCDQKQHRMNIANEMLDSVRDDPNLLQRVITGDEAWVYGYDVETKAQSSQWKLAHEPKPKKARQVRSNVKVLLTVFFDCRGVVHHEFLPQGRTHDNAPAHTSLLVRDILAKNNTLMMPQPPKLKRPMKERRYATLDEIKTASKEELKNDFLKCFEDWKKPLAQAYKEILVRLRNAIRRKRNQPFESKQWKLLYDNAPAHRAIIVQDYLAKHSVSVLPHPPYFPDIAPCDFFFFPKLKMRLKGKALFIVIGSNLKCDGGVKQA